AGAPAGDAADRAPRRCPAMPAVPARPSHHHHRRQPPFAATFGSRAQRCTRRPAATLGTGACGSRLSGAIVVPLGSRRSTVGGTVTTGTGTVTAVSAVSAVSLLGGAS